MIGTIPILKVKGKYIYKKITQKIGFSKHISIVKKYICTEVIFHYIGDSTPISFSTSLKI